MLRCFGLGASCCLGLVRPPSSLRAPFCADLVRLAVRPAPPLSSPMRAGGLLRCRRPSAFVASAGRAGVSVVCGARSAQTALSTHPLPLLAFVRCLGFGLDALFSSRQVKREFCGDANCRKKMIIQYLQMKSKLLL